MDTIIAWPRTGKPVELMIHKGLQYEISLVTIRDTTTLMTNYDILALRVEFPLDKGKRIIYVVKHKQIVTSYVCYPADPTKVELTVTKYIKDISVAIDQTAGNYLAELEFRISVVLKSALVRAMRTHYTNDVYVNTASFVNDIWELSTVVRTWVSWNVCLETNQIEALACIPDAGSFKIRMSVDPADGISDYISNREIPTVEYRLDISGDKITYRERPKN